MPAQTRKKTAAPGEAGSAPKPSKAKQPEPEPTHRVLRSIVIDGEQREVDDLVHLDGLNAAELESTGYAVKL